MGGFIVRQEQISSTFIAAPSGSPTDPSIIGFETYLVATDVVPVTIPANHFCVLAGFSWSYRSVSNDVSLGVPLPAATTSINAALANGLLSGSPSAPGFPGWLALTSSPLFECPLLAASPATISVAAGGTQTMALNAGRNSANSPYLVVGSTSGTSPGTFVGPFFVALNTPDSYFTFTLNMPNPPFFSGLGGITRLERPRARAPDRPARPSREPRWDHREPRLRRGRAGRDPRQQPERAPPRPVEERGRVELCSAPPPTPSCSSTRRARASTRRRQE